MLFLQLIEALAGHLGSSGGFRIIFLRFQFTGLSARRSNFQLKCVADLLGDRIHLSLGQCNPFIVATAQVFYPPKADRDMQSAELVFRPAHGGLRQHSVFAVDELADAHVAGFLFVTDFDREPDRLAIFQLLPGPFPVRRQCGGQKAQQQDEAQQ